MAGFDDPLGGAAMDRAISYTHGSILVLTELFRYIHLICSVHLMIEDPFRCSNGDWERTNREIEENILHEVMVSESAANEVSGSESKGGGGFGMVHWKELPYVTTSCILFVFVAL